MSAVIKEPLPDWVTAPGESQLSKQLRWATREFQPILAEPGVSDLHINGAAPDGETPVFIKRYGKRERRTIRLTALQLEQIGANAAVLGGGQLTDRMPFSPGRFPGRQRAQLIRPPGVSEGRYSLSVRSRFRISPTPDDLERMGVFDETDPSESAWPRAGTEELLAMKAGRKWRPMIETLYRYGYNGVFAGPMNSGKTTNLLSFFHAVSPTRRVGTVQDAEELEEMPQDDVVHMLYPKDTGGVYGQTAEGCVEAALRMDVDEIVNGEVRDGAAWALMRAGAAGTSFKTSLHADSAEGAFYSLLYMSKQHPVGRTFNTADLMQTFYQLVDFVVFSEVVNDQRRVTQIWFDPSAKRGVPKNVKPGLKVEIE
jgi:type IV secretion system protein VirB11